jgi:hypothetical protein
MFWRRSLIQASQLAASAFAYSPVTTATATRISDRRCPAKLRWPAAPAITVVNRDPQLALGRELSSPSTWSGPPLPDPDV